MRKNQRITHAQPLTGKVFLESYPRARAQRHERAYSRGIARRLPATEKGLIAAPSARGVRGETGVALVTFDFAKLQSVITKCI